MDTQIVERVYALKEFEKHLLPCPFCGGKGVFLAQHSYCKDDYTLFIECEDCEAQSMKVPAEIKVERIRGLSYLSGVCPDPEYNCVNELLKFWNKRTRSEPKRPNKGGIYYMCPSCGQIILRRKENRINIAFPHCKWCGQALDWR